jgi:hypothetical protein
MSDDWRMRVGLVDEGAARALTERLEAERLGEGLQTAFSDQVIVSGEGADVFCYAGERAQAEMAAHAIRTIAAEHAERVATEREESAERGYAEYEVKVHCSSHRDTVKLAHRLHDEGLPIVRRWKYLLVGASDEDAANALAERLRAEAPAGATVTAEVSQRAAWDDDPGRGSFAMFGGLGG